MIKVLYFSADWCGPCKVFKPIVQNFIEENKDKFELEVVDIEEKHELAIKMAIKAVPTIICLKNDDVALKFSGAMKKEDFKNKLNNLL